MALDFPANPANGQVYGSYVYNGTVGAWQGIEETAPLTITSPTAPTSASPGDLWFNSSNGILFNYYSDGTSSQWVEVLSSAVPNATEIMPAGTVTQTARLTAPTGWLLCEGQAVSRTTYVRLFDAIGTAYGSGDGSTTFTVPNLKGRIPVGRDSSQTEFDALGEAGGAKTHTLTTSEMPSHTHVQNSHNHTQDSHNHTQNAHNHNFSYSGGQYSGWPLSTGGGGNVTLYVGNDAGYSYVGIASNTATNQATTATNQATTAINQSTGGDGAHNNLQPYIVLNYMIKV